MSVKYCSENCQANHWKNGGHRNECSRLRKVFNEFIVIDKSSTTDGPTTNQSALFQKPSYVAFDEPFTIKIERFDQPRQLLHLHDKELECDFYIGQRSATSSFDKLLDKIKTEPAFVGTCAYLVASFDKNGMCSVFLNRRKVKTW
jgi:hypothetical protein